MNPVPSEAVQTVVRAASRRAFCGGVLAAAMLCGMTHDRVAAADELPVTLQAELVVRLASYDKNMKARSGDHVNVLIFVKPGDADSEHGAAQLTSALGHFEHIATLPIGTQTVAYLDPPKLVEVVRANHGAVIFLMPQLASEVEPLAAALDKIDVLTIAPSADMTRRGMVLGFELVSSRPKLFINLTQAEKQNVSMPADVLKLMTLYR